MKTLTYFLTILSLTISTLAEHFYTTDPHGELAPGLGYHLEGAACYVSTTQQSGTVPIYRWMNPKQGLHFYTADPNGELAPQLGYDYEGIAYYLFPNEVSGSVPFYRWNGKSGHFYTTNAAEGSNTGFAFEGITGWVFPGPVAGFGELYRWINDK
ncbi:uncharacterized protein PAC_02474 [Phialocephala subalpina]|uniref:DUF5648 domain-containing protein n=1 Tax=Phialocephala subalpina TaxID=576137 RepID=A0A1L7WIK6_9HELO|nr:uncharacterized protein PAC_02474 [Phialocephala subalpina]